MNKKTRFIVGLLLLMAPLASQVVQLSHHPKTLLRCEAEITARNRYGPAMEPAAVLKAKMYFFLYHNGTGFIRLNGFIERQEKTYVLNRELHYVYDTPGDEAAEEDGGGDGYTLRFAADRKHAGDTVPAPLWATFLQSEDPRISYHVAIEHVLGNLYVVSTLQSPTFVCRRY
ncbi:MULTISPECIES: hypothetical protein [Serratia]|uniref:hypothetical protein n=1 Tax=Serratia TaxID=613 RepID=UPI000B5EAA8F|nr:MULTISPECIES: hypothetical protein [Serratia]ASM01303.1 hypothetical protein BVG88_03630 [Serratia marcescens]EMD1302271.1 hypothetical protein [Serratia marcescens]MBH2558828.1 hypothetical protein [Serratia ureilytica]MBH2991131.1 hypothetical protein [Serratia ureilytica]MBH3115852.1 hypothetical protein [Serratia ureilytica]